MSVIAKAEVTISDIIDGNSISEITNFYKVSSKSFGETAPQTSGGRNLLLNSDFSKGTYPWTAKSGTLEIITDDTQGQCLTINPNDKSGVYYNADNILEADRLYSYSLMAKASVDGVTIQPSRSRDYYSTSSHRLTTKWERYEGEIKTTLTVDTGTLSITVNHSETTNPKIYIAKIKLEYGNVATDWTPAPEDLGWSTTVPTLTDTNKYLWNYEMITGSDGQVISYTEPRVIGVYGDKGQTGSTGATGNGIKSITEYYQISTSNTTAPTTWLTTVPTLTATNKYLWNYEKITYTNGTSVDTAKRVIGVYGDKGNTGATGPAGKGIKSTAITYQASTSGTTEPTGTWNTSVPSVPQGQYLWSRTVITYTDNSTSATYSVAYIPKNGQNGATGSTGATGTGVDSITQQYYLSTSKTTQTGGSWVTSMPTWSSGKYLWTRYKIDYKNPTSTSYTSPVCDSSWEAVNEVQADIDEAAKTATNYMNFDNNGLVIGDLTKGTLGRNVLIDSDSVDIRNGTNTLATFSDNLIELGKGNTNSAIKLCNGVGEINLTKNAGTSDMALMPDYSLNINSGYTYLNGMYLGLNADNTFLDKNVPFENLANAEVHASAGVDTSYVCSTAQSGLSVHTRGVNEASYIILNANSFSKKTSITISSQYNDERSKASTINISPDGIKIESGDLYDKYDKIFPNGVPVYGGGNGPDPNTTLDSLILSAHANAPSYGFYYIYTAFYDNKTTTSNRGQFAIPYGDSSNYVYYRFYYNGSWSAWYQLADQNDLNSVSSRVTTAQDTANFALSKADRAVNWVGKKHNERLSVEWAMNSGGVWTMYFYIDGALVRTW